ncbi:triafestin-1-like isoform X2 [Rhodnius prolixus]|uniref:Putative salivary lipocalin n=2 Tax=Rhodnius TaxID=13248 RepID=R4FN82_RHOPR
MNTVLIILGTIAFAFAEQPPTVQECLNLTAKANFEPQNYFKGVWYLSYIKYADPTGICRVSKLDTLSDGSVQKKTYGYTESGKGTDFFHVNCNGTLKSGGAIVSFHCEQSGNEGGEPIKFEMDGKVLETDYNNFSVYYICYKSGENLKENFLVASRHKGGEVTDDSKIAETLKTHGQYLDKFVSNKNVICKDHPDF